MHASDIVILVLIVLAVLYFYLTRHFHFWKTKNIPHKKPILLFGNLYDVVIKKESIAYYFVKLYNEFNGPYFGFYGMRDPFLVIKDLSIIKKILITDFKKFSEKSFISCDNVDPIFSRVLFTQKQPLWSSVRTKLSSLFSSGKLKAMLTLLERNGNNLYHFAEKNADLEIDVREMSTKYFGEVMANLAFGNEINSLLNEKCEFIEVPKRQFATNFTRLIQPLSYTLAHPLVHLFRLKFIDSRSGSYLRRIFMKTITERERTPNIKKHDMIDSFLRLKSEYYKTHGFHFSDDNLAAHAIMFYIAGIEGVSNTITFSLLELAINPCIQNRLRKEIKDIIAHTGDVTYEAIQRMEYLSMVISETLRKYPLTAFTHRRCTEKYLIEKTGLVLEHGQSIFIPILALHMDPKYFPEPEKYDPERFSEENKGKIKECSYLPFSLGPRNCIGRRLTFLIVQLALIKLISNFTVEKALSLEYPLQFSASFFLQPKGGINLILRKVKCKT